MTLPYPKVKIEMTPVYTGLINTRFNILYI